MREFIKFGFFLFLFTLAVGVFLYFLIPSFPQKFRYDGWWKILCFFVASTSVFHFGLIKSVQKKATSITIYFMAATTFKLLLFVGIMAGYAILYREYAVSFIFNFFIMYLLYTIFEVSVLYKRFNTAV